MAWRGTSEEFMAQQIGQGIAQLFAPKSNQSKMQYMLQASQVAQNQSQIGRNDAAAALDGQTYDNRTMFTPDSVASAFNIDATTPQGLAEANLIAASLGQGGNAEQAIDGLNAGWGGRMIRNGNNDAVRRGTVLTGLTPATTDSLTASERTGAFAQERGIANAKNASEIRQAQIAAAAQRYGTDVHYGKGGASDRAAQIQANVLGKLINVSPGATVFDPATRQPVYTAPAAPGKGNETSVSEAAQIAREIVANMPEGYTMDPQQLAEAVNWVATEAQRTGNAAQALADVSSLFTLQDNWWPMDNTAEFVEPPMPAPAPVPQPVPPAPVAPTGITRTIGGVTYRQDPTSGKWFTN